MISLKFGYDLGISNTWDICVYIYTQNIANCLSNGISTFQINKVYPTNPGRLPDWVLMCNPQPEMLRKN